MSVSLDNHEDEEAPERLGKFVLLRPIREDGPGVLVLAYDTAARRIVLLKRLHPSQHDADAVARFLDEIQLSFRLRHPNLMRAVENGILDDEVYLALHWIQGQDAAAIVERARGLQRPVALAVAAGIIRQLLRALEFSHAQVGFVRRDVSPGNVMVGYDGIVRLVNYGFQLFDGNGGFLAPEQRAGEHADVRTDLFALGAVLHYLLTGEEPAAEGEDADSKSALKARLEQKGVSLPAPMLTFLWRVLQAAPAQRYATAAEMAKALEVSLGEPLASEREIEELLGRLFPLEKEASQQQATAWRRQLGPAGDTPLPFELPAALAAAAAKMPVPAKTPVPATPTPVPPTLPEVPDQVPMLTLPPPRRRRLSPAALARAVAALSSSAANVPRPIDDSPSVTAKLPEKRTTPVPLPRPPRRSVVIAVSAALASVVMCVGWMALRGPAASAAHTPVAESALLTHRVVEPADAARPSVSEPLASAPTRLMRRKSRPAAVPPRAAEPAEPAPPSDEAAPVAADRDAAAMATARVARRPPDEPAVDSALQVRESQP